MTPRGDGAVALIGRTAELAAVETFLRDPAGSALVVRGGPGVGKTTVVEEAFHCLEDTVDVMRINGRASGASGPYSATLANLEAVRQHPTWRPWADEFGRTVERRAAAVDPDPVVDATALANELATLSERFEEPERRTVVLVDDLEAADAYSQEFVAVSAERAGPLTVSYVVTTSACTPVDAQHEVELDGLGTGEVRELLEVLLGYRVPYPVALGVREATAGMPLAIREIVGRLSTASLRGSEPLPVPLPTTERLHSAYRPALDGLAPRAVAALAMFSCRPSITLEAFAAAVGGIDEVDELIRRDLVHWQGGVIGPASRAQPAVAWSASTLSDLATAAGRLVAATSDSDERLIFGLVDHTSNLDEWTPELTERLATVANDRTAAAMASLTEQRCAGSADVALLAALALAYEGMGATSAALRVVERGQRLEPRGDDLLRLQMCRARVNALRGFSLTDDGSWDVAVADGAGDPAVSFDVRIALAASHTFQDQAELARVELDHATVTDDVPTKSRRRADLVRHALGIRSAADTDIDAYRIAITQQVTERTWESWPYTVAFARDLLALGEPRSARRLLKQRLGGVISEVEQCAYLAALAEIEAWSGRFRAALDLVREIDLLLPSTASAGLNLRGVLIWCHAATGDGEDLLARYNAESHSGVGPIEIYTRAAATAYQHLTAARFSEAADLLLVVLRNSPAVPHLVPECLSDLVEALSASGDVAGARLELKRGLDHLVECTSARTRHLLARCELLTGDLDQAYVLDDHEPGVDDATRARTLIAYARRLIDAGRIEDAQAPLGRAEQIARLWGLGGWLREVERLRDVDSEDTAPWNQLSPEERRIVAMVVDGARNREIAADLFVSLRSAEAALTRIFRTVGVANRRELIAFASRSGRFDGGVSSTRKLQA